MTGIGTPSSHNRHPLPIVIALRRYRERTTAAAARSPVGRYRAGPISFWAKYVICNACNRAACSMSASPEWPPAVSS